MRYVPGSSASAEYAPSSLLAVFVLTPVASFVITTVTCGTGAPEESLMAPTISPSDVCPQADVASAAQKMDPYRQLRRGRRIRPPSCIGQSIDKPIGQSCIYHEPTVLSRRKWKIYWHVAINTCNDLRKVAGKS